MKIIAFSGLTSQSGTTTVSTALAWSLATKNYKVLLLNSAPNAADADFHLNVSVNDGWMDALQNHEDALSKGILFENKLWYLPSGVNKVPVDIRSFNRILSNIEMLNIDFLIIDAGLRKNTLWEACVKISDLSLTTYVPTPNSLIHFNTVIAASNEYFVSNRYKTNSTVMNDIDLLLRNSSFANRILSPQIPDDEFILAALMQQKPFTLFTPFSASSLEIEKLIIDILLKTQKDQDA